MCFDQHFSLCSVYPPRRLQPPYTRRHIVDAQTRIVPRPRNRLTIAPLSTNRKCLCNRNRRWSRPFRIHGGYRLGVISHRALRVQPPGRAERRSEGRGGERCRALREPRHRADCARKPPRYRARSLSMSAPPNRWDTWREPACTAGLRCSCHQSTDRRGTRRASRPHAVCTLLRNFSTACIS